MHRRLLLGVLAVSLVLPFYTTEENAGQLPQLSIAYEPFTRVLNLPFPRPSSTRSREWAVERADALPTFSDMGDRSLALDDVGQPHIAYGGDLLYHAWYDGALWHTETVDDSTLVGRYTSLALDTNGWPRISYYVEGPPFWEGQVRFAQFNGADWEIETIDSGGWQGNSLALDSADRPHLAYFDRTSMELRYARRGTGAWITETVSHGAVTWYVSLAMDSEDRPHIAYFDFDNSRIAYAHHNGTAWITDTVSSNVGGQGYTSLALGPDDLPHISYFDTTGPGLIYAYQNGTSWFTETVDSTYAGCFSSIQLDSAGLPRISYFACGPVRDLKYARRDGVGWVVETVESTGDVGWYTSLALDAVDHPHISYCDLTNGVLKHAASDGSLWNLATVDRSGIVGTASSLALDQADVPHIGYQCSLYGTNAELLYARRTGGSWVSEKVDGSDGRFTSIALDSLGQPHVCYSNAGLRYARFDGTVWVSQTVVGDVGTEVGYAFLTLDQNDSAHISFCDFSSDDLVYAWSDGSDWFSETVHAGGCVWQTSLALDLEAHPHISYVSTGGTLGYAHYDGSTWHRETVGDGGYFNSLAVDADGVVHISSLAAGTLLYARRDRTGWQTEIVDQTGESGWGTSMALDAAGRPQIGYCIYYTDPTTPIEECSCDELRFAYHDGTDWQIETVDSDLCSKGAEAYVSLGLGSCGRPNLAYYDGLNGDLMFARDVTCTPVETATIRGPTFTQVGRQEQYTATHAPTTATCPLITWQNGEVGPTVAISWTIPGTQSLSMTVTNPCSEVRNTLEVQVCQPVEGVDVTGPLLLPVGTAGTYSATYRPSTATLPVALTWDNASSGSTASYSWTLPGTQTLTATANNPCGEVRTAYSVEVCQPVERVSLEGPCTLLVQETGRYTASYVPSTATLPLTITWGNGTIGTVASYSWTLPGRYSIVVTATSHCGQRVSTSRSVDVNPFLIFLPLFPREHHGSRSGSLFRFQPDEAWRHWPILPTRRGG